MNPIDSPQRGNPRGGANRDSAERIRKILDLIDELQSVDESWPLTELPVGLVCADFLRALEWPNSIITAVLGFDVQRWVETESVATVELARHEVWGGRP